MEQAYHGCPRLRRLQAAVGRPGSPGAGGLGVQTTTWQPDRCPTNLDGRWQSATWPRRSADAAGFSTASLLRPMVALGCVALALALRTALGLVDPGIVPFATLYPALVAAALLGGLVPGMTALVIGCWVPGDPAAVALASPSITEHSREPGRAGHNGWRVGRARRHTSQSDHPAACEPGTAPAGDPIDGPGHVGSRWCHRLAPLVRASFALSAGSMPRPQPIPSCLPP